MVAQIRIFTKKFCPGCTMTKQLMDRLKLEYQTIDISDDPAAIEALRALGYYSVPIVMVDNGSNVVGWTGFRPDKIKDLVNS
jgi:glutaredoxin-like protein NrdH